MAASRDSSVDDLTHTGGQASRSQLILEIARRIVHETLVADYQALEVDPPNRTPAVRRPSASAVRPIGAGMDVDLAPSTAGRSCD
jgi:hypothetical protein